MKNVINETPKDILHGRALYTVRFIEKNDIASKICLDIGCGYGWLEQYLIDHNARQIIGMEINEENLITARTCLRNKRIQFKVGSAIKLPFKNNSFDSLYSFEVIEHVPVGTENLSFKEAYRVLKPDGVLYLSTPNKNLFSTVLDPAWWLIGHRHYDLNRLLEIAISNGFKTEKTSLAGGKWEVIGTLNMYISKWIFRRKPFFSSYLDRLRDKEFLCSKGFTNIFIKLAKN